MTLRIVTQNIRHGGGNRERLQKIVDQLRRYDADILVVSEFRNNAGGLAIESALLSAGYVLSKNLAVPRLNGLLIAIRRSVSGISQQGSLSCPQRLLQVRAAGLNICGVYMPNLAAKIPYWEQILNACCEREGPNLFIGDFNTGSNEFDRTEGSVRYIGAEYIQKIQMVGYHDLYRFKHGERREYSWFSHSGNGFRIDHAFGDMVVAGRLRGCFYDHQPREQKITDHSALVLELE